MGSQDATIVLTLLAKDLASGNIQKVAAGLGALQKSGGLAGTALKGAGALATAGFGAITVGALGAEKAQGTFMAATGASRDQAKAFVSSMDGIVGSAGTVGMSFDQLAKVGTDVANQFGTTGQATADLTDQFSAFAKVSGQDADQAVLSLNDAMTAFGEPTKNAAQDMDLLIASHQKFGTDVGPATIQTLQNIAPALTTLGGDFQDGVGLMNAFETAGVDANGAMKDLTSVIKTFPPGTTLDSVITQLGAIQDPAARAQKAVELFGAKAGPALAKVIQPGMTSLDNFKVSVDDAKGSTQDAAANMETFGQKVQGALEKAGAAARDLGQQFGPALSGIATIGSAIGPKLLSSLGDMFKGLAIKILPAATAVGVAEGGAQAEGATGSSVLSSFLTKFGLLTPAKVEAAAAAGELEGAAEGEAAATAMAGAKGLGGAAASSAVTTAGLGLGGLFAPAFIAAASIPILDWFDKNFGQTPAQAEANANAAVKPMSDALTVWAAQQAAGMGDAGANASAAFGQTFRDGMTGIDLNDKAAWDALVAKAKAAGIAAGQASGENTATTFDSVLTGSSVNAFTGFVTNAKPAAMAAGTDVGTTLGKSAISSFNEMSPQWGQAAASAVKAFDQKVLDSRGQAQDAWTQFVDMMKHPLDSAAELAQLKGELASKKMQQGLASNDPQVRTWAENTRDAIQSRIDDLEHMLGQDGTNAGEALANHLRDTSSKAAAAASALAMAVNRNLSKIVTGVQVHVDLNGEQYGHGLRIPTFAAGGFYPAGQPRIVGENGPELDVPSTSGYIYPNVPRSSAGSSSEVHVHLHLDSVVPYSGAQMQAAARAFVPELTRELRRQRLLPGN